MLTEVRARGTSLKKNEPSGHGDTKYGGKPVLWTFTGGIVHGLGSKMKEKGSWSCSPGLTAWSSSRHVTRSPAPLLSNWNTPRAFWELREGACRAVRGVHSQRRREPVASLLRHLGKRVPRFPQIVLENLSSPTPGLPHPLTSLWGQLIHPFEHQ